MNHPSRAPLHPLLRLLLLPLALVLLAACGDAPAAGTGTTEGAASPRETFEAMVEATLAGDWERLYALNLPSERAAAEARWDEARAAARHEKAFAELAEEAGLDVAATRTMTLREYFARRNAHQAAASAGRMEAALEKATFVEARPIPEGGVMTRFRSGDMEQQLPMTQEGGRWYFHRILTALTDF